MTDYIGDILEDIEKLEADSVVSFLIGNYATEDEKFAIRQTLEIILGSDSRPKGQNTRAKYLLQLGVEISDLVAKYAAVHSPERFQEGPGDYFDPKTDAFTRAD